REHLRQALLVMAERFGTPPPDHRGPEDDAEIAIPRPPHWGGYQLWVEKLELWVEGKPASTTGLAGAGRCAPRPRARSIPVPGPRPDCNLESPPTCAPHPCGNRFEFSSCC